MRVFISYAHESSEAAQLIAHALNAAGFSAFIDAHSLPPGEEFNARIQRELDLSDAMVFLASPRSLAEDSYAAFELRYAAGKWPDPSGRVLPLLADGVTPEQLPPYLRSITARRVSGNAAAEVVAWARGEAAGPETNQQILQRLERRARRPAHPPEPQGDPIWQLERSANTAKEIEAIKETGRKARFRIYVVAGLTILIAAILDFGIMWIVDSVWHPLLMVLVPVSVVWISNRFFFFPISEKLERKPKDFVAENAEGLAKAAVRWRALEWRAAIVVHRQTLQMKIDDGFDFPVERIVLETIDGRIHTLLPASIRAQRAYVGDVGWAVIEEAPLAGRTAMLTTATLGAGVLVDFVKDSSKSG